MKKSISVFCLFFILGLGLFFAYRFWLQWPIHFHAGFKVYVDNQLQDYSAEKFMDVEPCTAPGHKAKVDDQLEKAHLHDQVGDVVHVHRHQATWGDLFTNLHVSFDHEAVVGYKQGKKIDNILTKTIEPYESVVIVVGDQSKAADYAGSPVTVAHIKDIESRSETCGS
jgi:hypothetical protein